MSRQSLAQQEKDQELEYLHEYLKPGDTAYTILRHVSRSGMQRSISVLVMTENGKPYDVSLLLVRVGLGRFDHHHDGVKVDGCGMDMGFHLVYNLSYTMFPNGFGCVGEGCPSNDHFNGDRDYTPDMSGKSTSSQAKHWHKDGGYALLQRWL